MTPPNSSNQVQVILSVGGRYIVEVRDNSTWHATRIQDDSGHPERALSIPEVNAYFNRVNRRAKAVSEAWRAADDEK